MSFNKRTFSFDMLRESYRQDPENGITKLIGKTDAFFYSDNLAAAIVDAWMEGDKQKVAQIMSEYVS
jgi:hypothetical protein